MSSAYPGSYPPQPRKSRLAKVVALLIVVVILVAAYPLVLPQIRNLLSSFGINSNQQGKAPEFNLTSFTAPSVTLPQDYSQLANYVLTLINQDRNSNSLGNVSLSSLLSAQQHADSMVVNHYFSHWDTQGLKPYMRFSLYNGTGFVQENVAWESQSPVGFPTTSSVENALKNLEYQMMYNDSICCQNGHRENILDSLHNLVGLGVAHDQNNVYLVEDFENRYISWSQYPSLSTNGVFSMSGQLSDTSLMPTVGYIYYDSFPQPLTTQQVSQSPYNGPYSPGSAAACVVKNPGLVCTVGGQTITTIVASTWTSGPGSSFSIAFDASSVIQRGGKGVYTVYLMSNSSPLTSISFFVSG